MKNHDLAELVDTLMPHAIDCLCQRGEMQPYGACVDHFGTITPHVARIGGRRRATPREIDGLTRGFQKLAAAGQIRAIGLCRLIQNGAAHSSKDNAIGCVLEHANGESFDLLLPFRMDRKSQSVLFGVLSAKRRPLGFFVN